MVSSITRAELQAHTSERDCWLAIHGHVYDITTFLSQHPGGKKVLLDHAGSDASTAFDAVHPKELVEEYRTSLGMMGQLDPSVQSADKPLSKNTDRPTATEKRPDIPPVSRMLSIREMQNYALQVLSPKALSYYPSATDDEITKKSNHTIYRSILLRPRVFVDCTHCTLATTILGNRVDTPIFVSPAALAKLAHPAGEAGIASACSDAGALQIISKNASASPADIVAAGPGAVFAWQLYVLKDNDATERTLAQIRSIPQIKFIVLTLDAPFPGKREADERFKMAEVAAGAAPKGWGTESGLTWRKTLAWLTTQTDLPIVLKGIQTHEDAYAASLFPCVKGVILSNHGGRALDTTTTPVQVLLEMRKFCPDVFGKLDVLVDGGVERGTDVVKALALGAKGVGIGRAALYGLAVGGEEGVARTLKILADETTTAMRLLGVKTVGDLTSRHVNAEALTRYLFDGDSGLSQVDDALRAKL